MTYLCRSPGLTQKTKPCRFVTEISLTDDLQRHRAAEIGIECLVSDTHRTPSQLDRFAIFARHQFIVLKSLRRLFRCRLDRFLERSLAGFNPASENLAKYANRTKF